MQFVIVTGMSGSGKSCAMNVLEDIGFYCIDNIPPQLLTKFADISPLSKTKRPSDAKSPRGDNNR